jgi:hypothetical protein
LKGSWEERFGEAASEEYRVHVEAYFRSRNFADARLVDWAEVSPEMRRIWGRVALAVVHKSAAEKA